jgi:hypothetical protein
MKPEASSVYRKQQWKRKLAQPILNRMLTNFDAKFTEFTIENGLIFRFSLFKDGPK